MGDPIEIILRQLCHYILFDNMIGAGSKYKNYTYLKDILKSHENYENYKDIINEYDHKCDLYNA